MNQKIEILNKLHLVRDTFESLDLGPVAARVFEFHFFQDGNFSEWEGPETLKQLYEIYNGVQELIKKENKWKFIVLICEIITFGGKITKT